MRIHGSQLILLLILALSAAASTQDTQLQKSKKINWQFRKWYPQFRQTFSSILNDSCHEPYQIYLSGLINKTRIDWVGGGDTATVLVQPVILCILTHSNDYVKSAMASAQVLLGLTPTIVAFMSPSAQELALLSNISKRPVLALMLSLCTPTTHLSRLFEYTNPQDHFKTTTDRYKPRPSRRLSWWISAAEYLLAGLAMANLGILYWQLTVQTVCSWWPDGYGGIFLWGLLNMVAYLGGAIMLATQLRPAETCPDQSLSKNPPIRRDNRFARSCRGLKKLIRGVKSWLSLSRELQISASRGKIYVRAFPERKWFIALYWFLCLCFLVHLVYGTMYLSSLLFIGPRDALSVIGRLVASVFVSRTIVSFELAGLCANGLEIVNNENNKVRTEGSMMGEISELPSEGGLP